MTNTLYSNYVKRVLDFILSLCAVIVLSPVFLVLAFLELVFHGRPVIFSQERVGKDNRIFKIYKFRSMTNEKDGNGELLPDEKRLTGFGRLLRRTSLDELPSLVSILRGDMAIVGPRPLLPEYLSKYSTRQKKRHCVRPGLACVRIRRYKGEHIASSWTWEEQLENDIWYIQNVNFWTDAIEIIAIAKKAMVGSETRTNATRGDFMGTDTD